MARASSPDSSVSISSLLASCSLRSSNRRDTRAAASIQYKDRLYDSASEALLDYIVDYEAASAGKITIRPSTALTSPNRRACSSVRHKPSRSRYAPRDPDLLSLTTDDLLIFPPDGSLPFTKVSEQKRKKKLRKQYGFSTQVDALASPFTSVSQRGRSLSALDLQDHRLRFQDLERSKKKGHLDHFLQEMERENDSRFHNSMNSPLYKSYPRWLTSQKSELGVSGITSVPNVQYPVWLRDHGLLDDLDNSIARTVVKNGPIGKISNRLSSSTLLDSSQMRGCTAGNSNKLMDSRKHLTWSDLAIMEHLHTPAKNHPVQKSEQTGGAACTNGSPQLPHNNPSPRTEDILEAERSWENVPYTYKSPVHVLCEDEKSKGFEAVKSSLVEDFLKDCVQKENTTNSFSGGNHHGPVEALKHMLFNLQTFQQNFNHEASSEHLKVFQKISTEAESELQKVDQEIFPVNKSLQKALHHLSRLKELVGDCSLKRKEDYKQDQQT